AETFKSKIPKTLLVHPFTNKTHKKDNEKPKYLLETPVELKRKHPLLEIPKDFNKKPKLYAKETENPKSTNEKAIGTEMRNTSIQTTDTDCQNHCQNPPVKICHHCCCRDSCVEDRVKVSETTCVGEVSKSCGCQNQPVKVIFAPAMMPSMFPMHGMQYIMKPPVKINEKYTKAGQQKIGPVLSEPIGYEKANKEFRFLYNICID
ncbi:jg9887, partial [Pararge aegeria aegeria]